MVNIIWKKVRIKYSLTALVLISFLTIHGMAVSAKQTGDIGNAQRNDRVVVLHSYHYGFSWSDSISEGIKTQFAKDMKEAEVKFEFLDTRFTADAAYLQSLKQTLEAKYLDRKVDVIIASDDHALNFMLHSGQDIFPDVPVVFCSVSGFVPEMRKQLKLTGLRESIDIHSTVKTALRLHPNTKDIAVILDDSRTGRALKKKTQAVVKQWSDRVRTRYLEDYTVDQLKSKLAELPKNTIVLLFIFRPDESGRVLSHEQNLEHIRPHCPVPIYAVWEFYLGHGIVGGRLTNGMEEGRLAALMAMRILNGEEASDIPLQESPIKYMFDHVELERFGITSASLPEDSHIINKPFSFYATYKKLIWAVIITFFILLGIILALIINIAARRQAEKTLQKNEEDLRITLNSVGDAVIATHLNGEIARMNPVAEELTGWKADEAIGRPLSDVFNIVHYKTRQTAQNPVARVIADGKIVGLANHTVLIAKDGREFQIADSAAPIRTIDGTLNGVVLVFRDVTDEYEKDRLLKESEDKYRQVVENANDAIFIAQDGIIQFANKKTTEILGYDSQTLKTISFTDFIHPEDKDMVIDRHLRRLRGETNLPTTYAFRIISRNDSVYTIQLSVVLIDWQGKPATLNFARDITEIIKLETSLYQAQKMEAIGTLAGGIAHDFNNLLMGIQGRASVMSVDFDSSSPVQEHIKEIEDYIRSATDLTSQLLGLARGGKYEVHPVDINDLLLKSASMFGRTKKEIRIHHKLDKPAPIAAIDRRQIEHTFLNLYLNAWQAMPDGGEIHLETRRVTLDKTFCKSHQAVPGHYVRISITDTGIGMDESIQQRIFDPFFTTKEKNRGTGLGLSSTYGIIRNHEGIITVYSEVGQGTTFNIYLPLTDQAAYREDDKKKALVSGSETILFVDDERMVLDVGKLMLEKLGYRVLTVNTGEGAVETIRHQGDTIDLVILDLIMPGIDGSKTFDRIREIHPNMSIILSSGYSLSGQANEIMKKGCNGFIQKPFNISELSIKVRNVLDEADGPVSD